MQRAHRRLLRTFAVWAAILLFSHGHAAAADDATAARRLPTSGWHNGSFFLRSPGGNFFLIPSGRLQVDGVAYFGDAIREKMPQNRLFLRRLRIELLGGMFERYTYSLAAEMTAASGALPTDNWLGVRLDPWLNVQVGQFDAPFTLENRTSDKYGDFLERSLAVGAFGSPPKKEQGLTLWGEDGARIVNYAIGVFNGDGLNRGNPDGDFDLVGRVFAHPLAWWDGPLANAQIGVSGWWGTRGRAVNYGYPAIGSPTGVTFWNTSGGVVGNAANPPYAIVADDSQLGLAVEVDLPVGPFDLRAEVVYRNNRTREMEGAMAGDAVTQLAGSGVRRGQLEGVGAYVQLGYWIALAGTVDADHPVNGRGGVQNPPNLRLDRPDPPVAPRGLQLLFRWDALELRYTSNDRFGPAAHDGRIAVQALQLGANYWASKHLRLSVNYSFYWLPDAANNLARGPLSTTTNAPVGGYHEVAARVGLAL